MALSSVTESSIPPLHSVIKGKRSAPGFRAGALAPPLAPLGLGRPGLPRPVLLLRNVLVGIERLLRRTQGLRYVLEVQADARPRAEAAAHRVHEDVRVLQMRAGVRVPRLPSLETRERVGLFTRASDLDERLRRGATARWRHARSLARLLAIVRRPRRVAESFGLVTRRQFEERNERSRMRVHAGVAIAHAREARRHRLHREVARLARLDLVPGERRRDARVRRRPHRVRAGDGAVLGVLVVVEEDAVTLLLPPLARRDLRRAP